ncbi:MAG: oligosaccharide flippase family protein, partial [Clostridiaceae bacterium]|nr:oligosaccharide flippase family protein [Clostridiaceae bacterium]
MTKRPLLAGTLLLTLAGLLSRILGFFYRIFLSRTIGAEGLGIYQMIFPIHGIAFALCAGPIQTSISRLTAASPEKGKAIFRTGLAISLTIAMALLFTIRTSK